MNRRIIARLDVKGPNLVNALVRLLAVSCVGQTQGHCCSE